MQPIQNKITMVKIDDIKLGEIIRDTDMGIPGLLQFFLNKIQSAPDTSSCIGWRDVKPSVKYENSWTFKINGFRGIYGLYFDDSIQTNDWLTGYFGITYFPHPDEELVERLSLTAVFQTQQADYFEKIPTLIAHSEVQSLFEVGRFSLAINLNETALILSLYAPSRHKVVTIGSVPSAQSEPPSFLIEPNGTDQNLPSFVIAYGLFKVLAATVTFSVQQPPDFLRRDKRRGNYFTYTHDGFHNVEPTSWINEIELHLGYGDAYFERQVESYAAGLSETLESVSWKTGEAYPEFAKKALWWTAQQIDQLRS